MNLIQAFEQNLIEGLDTSAPDKTIETIISKIFFYGDSVFKIYKYEKFFFGDFGLPKFRDDFYKEDFYWDNTMAPHVYLSLQGVKKSDNKYKITELSDAEDFFIKMKKFDDNKSLTNLLLNREIGPDELAKIANELIARLKDLTGSRKDRYKTYFERKLKDIQQDDLEGDRNLLYLIPHFIPKTRTDKIINVLKGASLKDEYYQTFDSDNLSAAIDNHADNIIFLNNKIEFVDVLPPKESWRVGDLNFVICRLATDAAVLHSPKMAEAVYGECAPMSDTVRAICETRSALIQIWRFCSIGKQEIAKKYLNFAEERIAFLKQNTD